MCGHKLPIDSPLQVPVEKVVEIANGLGSFADAIKNLSAKTIFEAKGSLSDVKIQAIQVSGSHNLYKVTIPIPDGEPVVAYEIKPNTFKKGEDPGEAMVRIMQELGAEVKSKLYDYIEKKDQGDEAGANKALLSGLYKDMDKAQATYDAVSSEKKKEKKPTSAQRRLKSDPLSRLSATHTKMVKKAGLLTGKDVAMKLGIRGPSDAPNFSAIFIDKATEKYPHWEELTEFKNLQPTDIADAFQYAKVTPDLIKFVAELHKIDADRLSSRAARALAAAARIAAAALIAADLKSGSEETEE